jgi:2-phospho-L-lactate/phosphoenolpyruvate guanylyltransferase
MRRIWAAIPIKEFCDAKQRLAPLLPAAQRRDLAAAMFEDVLEALAKAPIAGILVNTLESSAAALAALYGARVISTGARDGHSCAVAAMAEILAREGAEGMLTCPGDIPGIRSDEVAAVIAAHASPRAFTIVPAHDSRGSNAVAVSPPDLLPLRFGDDSFLPHLDAARGCGVVPTVLHLPGFALDIDHPQDARAFLDTPGARRTRAGRLLGAFMGARA